MLFLFVACALALVTSFPLRFSCWAFPDVVLREGLIFSSKTQVVDVETITANAHFLVVLFLFIARD
jgi:hypothetical protein